MAAQRDEDEMGGDDDFDLGSVEATPPAPAPKKAKKEGEALGVNDDGKTGRQSSIVWAYYTAKVSPAGQVLKKCKLCNKEIASSGDGTGSLRHHLVGKAKNGHHAFTAEEIAERKGLDSPIPPRPTIAARKLPVDHKLRLDRVFVEEAILHDGRPGSLGDPDYGKGLRRFLQRTLEACGATHSYELPSRCTVSRQLAALEEEENKLLTKEFSVLDGLTGRGTFLTDGWSAPDDTYYMGYFVIWIGADWVKRIRCLGLVDLSARADVLEG
jgi:hypothetical protein